MKEQLYLGIAREDITPNIGGQLFGYSDNNFSTYVHDPLYATAFFFKQGQTEVLMVNVNVCLINTELCEQIRSEICDAISIPVGNCVVSTTHTHTGPNTTHMPGWGEMDLEYVGSILRPQILKAAKGATANLTAVKVGIATGTSLVGINRRQLNPDNTVTLGQNPWGPFDPKMTVISFKDLSGKIVANMIHYGAHATAAGSNSGISRDWPGIMVDRLENITGGITAFFNGAAGDVGPRLTNGRTTGYNNIHFAEEHGAVAAADAVRIFKTITCYREADLACYAGVTKLPLKPRMPYEEVKAQLKIMEEFNGNYKAIKLSHLQRVLDSYEKGYEEMECLEVPQTVIRLGDVAFASFPYELFSEIAMRIDKASEIPHVLSLGYTNGHEQYFATQSELCRGGYEVMLHRLAFWQERADDVDWHLIKDTLSNLELLEKEGGTEDGSI